MDQYVARHPNLQSSLAAVKSGRPTAAQQREVSEYMRLFEEYKNSQRVTAPSGGR